jgi:hypothetical protein
MRDSGLKGYLPRPTLEVKSDLCHATLAQRTDFHYLVGPRTRTSRFSSTCEPKIRGQNLYASPSVLLQSLCSTIYTLYVENSSSKHNTTVVWSSGMTVSFTTNHSHCTAANIHSVALWLGGLYRVPILRSAPAWVRVRYLPLVGSETSSNVSTVPSTASESSFFLLGFCG